VKSFFGSYPESCRFFIYICWFLLLTLGIDAGGAFIAAYVFAGRACGFGLIMAADVFEFIARL